MKKAYKYFSCLVLYLSIQVNVNAQSPEEVKSLFPGTDIVYKTYDQELNFFMKDNLPVAERKTNIDMLMLTDKNSNMMSKYSVYHSGYSELTQLDAYTRPASGKKTIDRTDQKTSTSSSNSVFYDDSKETNFNFAGLTQNSIAHVDYTLFHKDPHLLGAFFIPSYMPIVNASFQVTVPNNMEVKYVVKNDKDNLFTFSTEKKKKETVYRWTLTNVKPETFFGDAPDFRYYQPHIIVYLASYEDKNGKQSFLNSLEDLYQWNYSFLKDLNRQPDNNLKMLVDSLTKDLKTDRAKAQAIYQWVQQHIKYVAFENGLEGFRPRQAAEVCTKRYGDCKDMSSIITQMLNIAGVKAYYTWIGTRDLPYKYSETPLPIVDNHMISTTLIDGKWYFLDGTDPNAKFEMPPAFIQGKEALVSISEKEYKLLQVPVSEAENNVIIDSTYISLNDDGVKGVESVHYKGYFGKEIYASLLYKDETEMKDYVNKRMAKGSNKFILGKYNITRTSPDENRANITADFELPGYSKKVGNEFFINLNLEKVLENQFIEIEKRKVPVESEFNYSILQYHVLAIPNGYTVSYVPKDYSFENDLVKVHLYYKVESHRIIAAQEVLHKKMMVETKDFAEWNKPMKAILPYYKESVVLESK